MLSGFLLKRKLCKLRAIHGEPPLIMACHYSIAKSCVSGVEVDRDINTIWVSLDTHLMWWGVAHTPVQGFNGLYMQSYVPHLRCAPSVV